MYRCVLIHGGHRLTSDRVASIALQIMFYYMCVGVFPACIIYAPCIQKARGGQKRALDPMEQ